MLVRSHGTRAGAALLAVLVAGCGSGDDGPSKDGYYKAINGFCGSVTAAAKQVSADTVAVQKDTKASQAARLKRITVSLQGFADATESALDRLEKAGVPDTFATYQEGTSKGFRTFIKTLRTTADESEKDAQVLTKLEARLNAVKLPDLPPDITANAKACAEFSPVTTK